MNFIPLEIIVPIYNEVKKLIKLLNFCLKLILKQNLEFCYAILAIKMIFFNFLKKLKHLNKLY